MKVDAIKDGKGNIVITEDSFEMLLACLDNQKFVGENPQNGDSLSDGKDGYFRGQKDVQDTIDFYNRECRKILHQKYVVETIRDGYYLTKKYEHQEKLTPWSGNDVGIVYELFKHTRIKYRDESDDGDGETVIECEDYDHKHMVEAEPRPWLIERPMMYDNDYLTISEDAFTNRPWTQEEIMLIQNALNKE